ncbi:MAG: DUF3179 domain-containing protein [Candidatus Latescibacteria bacterium]|nr:DUF3179 domain-containing protein [Candidatus Latescibacterota bacterium]
MMTSPTRLIVLVLLLSMGGMGCQDNANPSTPTTPDTGTPMDDPSRAGAVGFGVSGLLFNNNLVMYDRSRSDLRASKLVLIPQIYFTTIDAPDFPVYGTFPKDQLASGGPKIDDIPALTNPSFVTASGVDYLADDDLVIGLVLNGETRAYPHNVLWWHEIVNDQVGGQRVSVTFCPLTGTGLVFDITTPRDHLEMIPATEVTWRLWKQLHPETLVIARSNSNRLLTQYPYGSYQFENTPPLFPLNRSLDTRFPPKRMIHGILTSGLVKAYPFSSLGTRAAVNDAIVGRDVLVVFDQAGRLALSYDRRVNGQSLTFRVVDGGVPFRLQDQETGTVWTVEGKAIDGPLNGKTLTRISTAYNAFWFAWAAFWPTTAVYAL